MIGYYTFEDITDIAICNMMYNYYGFINQNQ